MSYNIQKHIKIVENCNKLIVFLDGLDLDSVLEIRNNSQKIIDIHNNSNLTIVNPTKTELGVFRSTVKKVVCASHINKLNKADKENLIYHDYEFICEEHRVYDEEYKDSWHYGDVCDKCQAEIDRVDDNNNEIHKKCNDRYYTIHNACEKTSFPKELIERYILARRNTKDRYRRTELERELNNALKLEILKIFNEQNQELILNLK